ncbi:unnamed protein product, partial [Phaeothamnion confervicola]
TWQWLERCDDADNFVLEGAQLLLSNPLLAWLPDTAIIYVFEPVAWFAKATLAGVIQLFGVPIALAPAPLIFRGATLFFHWLNSCLLLEATRHLLHLASPSFPTSSDGAAAIELLGCCLPAALAFAVHPVNVEVMGWASCFPYGLALLFALWSLLEYMRNVERNGNGDGCGGLRGAVLPPVLYAAAVLSKSAALLWPATFIQQRQRRRRRPGRPGRAAWALLRYAGGKAPYAAVAAAVAVVTLRVNDGGSSQTTDVIHLSPRERLAKAHLTVWMYARLLLWPEKLRSHYRLRASDMALGAASPAAAALLAQMAALHGMGGGICFPLLAWAHYVAVFLPFCGLVQHGVISKGGDRYGYLTYPAFVPLLAGALRARTYRGAAVRAVAAALALLPPLAVLAVMSAQQIKHWRTDETVLTRALAVDSGDWRMMDILLNHYSNGGRDAEAAALLERLRQPNVFADVPGDSPKKPLFRAKYDVVAGDLSAACAVYRAALPRWPDEPFLLHNVGLCML